MPATVRRRTPPTVLIASNTFWPSARTPSATSNEIDVACLSSRTRTTAPSRIRWSRSAIRSSCRWGLQDERAAAPRADAAPGGTLAVDATTLISRPPQRRVEFGLKQFLSEPANARPHAIYQAIEPIVAEKVLVFGGAGRKLHAIRRQG
jgi:hypothetical protein